jgi:hypothetical protein
MYNVKTNNGIVFLDFNTMTEEELRKLEYAVSDYRIEKEEQDKRKSVEAIINFIEAELTKCPGLKDSTACLINEDDYEYIDWDDLLDRIKDYAQS